MFADLHFLQNLTAAFLCVKGQVLPKRQAHQIQSLPPPTTILLRVPAPGLCTAQLIHRGPGPECDACIRIWIISQGLGDKGVNEVAVFVGV